MTDQQLAGVVMGLLGESASFLGFTVLFVRYIAHEEPSVPAPSA